MFIDFAFGILSFFFLLYRSEKDKILNEREKRDLKIEGGVK